MAAVVAPPPPGIDPLTGEILAGWAAQPPLVQRATHSVAVYPGCGEAVLQLRAPSCGDALTPADRLRSLDADKIADKAANRIARDTPIGSARAESEAARRAATQFRRWCTENRADHLWTGNLSPKYATHSRRDMWALIARFRRNLVELGVLNPLGIVLELHPGGHGFHWHAAVPGRMDWDLVGRAWSSTPHLPRDHPEFDPFGFVQFEPPRKHHRRTTSSALDIARNIAGYLAGYLSNSTHKGGEAPIAQPGVPLPVEREFNGKRFSTTRGTSPVCLRSTFISPAAAYSWVRSILGGEIRKQWDSSQSADWEGPPTALYYLVT